jgi:hypothetical protein
LDALGKLQNFSLLPLQPNRPPKKAKVQDSSEYLYNFDSSTYLKKRKLLFVDGNFLLDLKLTSSAEYVVDV